jgi:hypothetical protein
MGDTILTWHFTDVSGNTTTCPQTVTVKDKFAPVVDCDTLKNIVADLTTNDCRLSAPLSVPQSIDNCGAFYLQSLSSYPLGDTILTTDVLIIAICDTKNIDLTTNGRFVVPPDNCGAKITGVLSPVPTTYPMGDTILTWHFTDASGNTTTCPQTVTVKDKICSRY